MKLFVGIDLGSTTTKAVVLDSDGGVLGKGITNSRSNYDTACAIAQTEAFIATRFTLFRNTLAKGVLQEDQRERFMEFLSADFRLQQFLKQLDFLRQSSLGEANGPRHKELASAMTDKLENLFSRIAVEARDWFRPGVAKRSEFFRDLAGSAYMHLAEELAETEGVTYDKLVNIYDKCIIQVENTMLDLSFEGNIEAALDSTLAETGGSNGGSELERLAADETKRTALRQAVQDVLAMPLDVVNSVGTGYGRARLPFPKEQIRSEILCHGLGAHDMFPNTATVLDIGGQDTKAIQVDPEGIVTSFQMNDRCAAGCGRYLGYIADELNMGVQELGPLAMQSDKSVRINSTCTVFAGAELRERLNNGERREDILKGLHRAIILRAMSLLARSGGVADEFTFTGGVANNQAAVGALQELVQENYGERTINISSDSIYTGALGAALFSRMNKDGEGEAAA